MKGIPKAGGRLIAAFVLLSLQTRLVFSYFYFFVSLVFDPEYVAPVSTKSQPTCFLLPIVSGAPVGK